MTRLLAVLLPLLLLVPPLFLASPAQAQSCFDRATMESIIHDDDSTFRESVVMRGISSSGDLLEVWTNPETGTWSVTTTSPNGVICMRDFGEGFEAQDYVPPEAGDPA
jgi:hypothetical protein